MSWSCLRLQSQCIGLGFGLGIEGIFLKLELNISASNEQVIVSYRLLFVLAVSAPDEWFFSTGFKMRPKYLKMGDAMFEMLMHLRAAAVNLKYWPFSVFLTRNRLWPSYCQISTDLDKFLSTPIVIRNTLVGRRRPWSARGRFQAKPELMYFLFYNTCNAPYPIYYIDDGSPRFRRQTVKVEVRTGAIVKNSGIL